MDCTAASLVYHLSGIIHRCFFRFRRSPIALKLIVILCRLATIGLTLEDENHPRQKAPRIILTLMDFNPKIGFQPVFVFTLASNISDLSRLSSRMCAKIKYETA